MSSKPQKYMRPKSRTHSEIELVQLAFEAGRAAAHGNAPVNIFQNEDDGSFGVEQRSTATSRLTIVGSFTPSRSDDAAIEICRIYTVRLGVWNRRQYRLSQDSLLG